MNMQDMNNLENIVLSYIIIYYTQINVEYAAGLMKYEIQITT